tara:strand:+ start:2250 stop:2570 length:321 start_codon:yes stop_codon:yes gene_type:complete
MAQAIQPFFFFDVKNGLLTGNETELDFLLNGILSHDIQDIINGFIGDDEPEYPYIWREYSDSYIYYYDYLSNKYSLPVEDEEKYCFEQQYDDDFSIDDEVDSEYEY